MPTSILPYLNDLPDEPVSIAVLRAWWPVRPVLLAMGCPNRPPRLLSDGALGWDDTDHDDLPSCLPAALTGVRISIIGAASDGAIHYLLHAYQAAAQVIVRELSEGAGGRALVPGSASTSARPPGWPAPRLRSGAAASGSTSRSPWPGRPMVTTPRCSSVGRRPRRLARVATAVAAPPQPRPRPAGAVPKLGVGSPDPAYGGSFPMAGLVGARPRLAAPSQVFRWYHRPTAGPQAGHSRAPSHGYAPRCHGI